jgi:hypothetical protein
LGGLAETPLGGDDMVVAPPFMRAQLSLIGDCLEGALRTFRGALQIEHVGGGKETHREPADRYL